MMMRRTGLAFSIVALWIVPATARALSISAVMSSSNSCPGEISGSHHTLQPSASNAATRGATRALSALAYETKISAKASLSPR